MNAPTPTAAVPSYAAVHRRVVGQRGSARDQRCAECGRPARYWCYDGADPDEHRDPGSGRRYSLDPARYRPRCPSCHRAMATSHAALSPAGTTRAAALYRDGSSLAAGRSRAGRDPAGRAGSRSSPAA